MPEYQSAKNISIYLSMPNGEVSTRCIVEDALRKGKRVFVPYLYKERMEGDSKASAVMDMVSLHSELDYNSLQPDKWGIPTLDEASIPDRARVMGAQGKVEDLAVAGTRIGTVLDMMVMPGVAFDGERRRLGHGKGYYDSFLHRYQERLKMVSKEQQSSSVVKMPYLGTILVLECTLEWPNSLITSSSGSCSHRAVPARGPSRSHNNFRLSTGCRGCR